MRVFALENIEEIKTWGPVITENGITKPCKSRAGETFDGFIKALSTGLPPTHPSWKEAVKALGIEYDIQQKLKLKKGLGYKLEYRTISACDYGAATTRKRFFLIGRKDGAPIVWPKQTHGVEQKGLMPYINASDIIDWSLPVKSIYNRKKPIAAKTMRRITLGLEKYVFSKRGPFYVPKEYNTTFVSEKNSSNTARVHDNEQDKAFIIKYYGTAVGTTCDTPLDTITTNDRFALVVVRGSKDNIIDIGMRMFSPAELFKAQGFRDDFIIDVDIDGNKISKKRQVARCGNAVCPPVAKAIAAANVGGLPPVQAPAIAA